MLNKKTKIGFTLIELLVVIAIIGILSGIVLVSLKGATQRANDGRVMSDMDQIRSTAEILYGNEGNYGNIKCAGGDTDINTLCVDIGSYSASGEPTITLKADNAEYCAYVQLNSGDYWCVNSGLVSKKCTSSPATNCSNATLLTCN